MKVKLNDGKPADEAAISALEDLIGLRLSAQFLDFLRENNGARPDSNIVAVADKISSNIRSFIYVEQILKDRAHIENISPNAYPIAEDGCGNFFFLDEGRSGSVYFWDHEQPWNDYKIAGTFNEFLEKLEPFDSESITLEPGQVKKVWVHPDLSRLITKRPIL